MKLNSATWKRQHMQRRVGEWVAEEMVKSSDHGDTFAEDLALRSTAAIGTEVPVATIKAHIFAIQKRLVKEASEVGRG